jgi:DNA invertase Pin-like site-specific DNA recombinase
MQLGRITQICATRLRQRAHPWTLSPLLASTPDCECGGDFSPTELVFGIFASIAEFERSLITERIKSGQAAAKRRGIKFGRPRVDVNAKRLMELRGNGVSYANIAKATGLSVGTIFRTLGCESAT